MPCSMGESHLKRTYSTNERGTIRPREEARSQEDLAAVLETHFRLCSGVALVGRPLCCHSVCPFTLAMR